MGRGNDKRQQILNQLFIAMSTASMHGTKSSSWPLYFFPQRSSSLVSNLWCRNVATVTA
jgi:hypothetical protein